MRALKCRYCFSEALEDVDAGFRNFEADYCLPKRISYDAGLLDRFWRQDIDCVLTFYGGDPLLCIDEIKQIMDYVKAECFLIQTNGLFLSAC